jgi:activator of HSP90 ATPase
LTYKEAIQDIRRRNSRYDNEILARRTVHRSYSINSSYTNNTKSSIGEKAAVSSEDQGRTQSKTVTASPVITFNIPAGTKVKLLNSVILYSDSDINLNAELLNGHSNNIIKYITNLLEK